MAQNSVRVQEIVEQTLDKIFIKDNTYVDLIARRVVDTIQTNIFDERLNILVTAYNNNLKRLLGEVHAQYRIDIERILKEASERNLANSKHIADQIAKIVEQKIYSENLSKLEEENLKLRGKLNTWEQFYRRQNVRLFGVKEEAIERNLDKTVIDLFKKHLNINIESADIEECYRAGKNRNSMRPIFIRFANCKTKLLVIRQKRKFKGTGIELTEDLTNDNLKIYKSCISKLGKKNVWLDNGKIIVRDRRGTQHIKHGEQVEDLS